MFLNNLQVSGLICTDDDLWGSSVTEINLKDYNLANKFSVVNAWHVSTVARKQTVSFLIFFAK